MTDELSLTVPSFAERQSLREQIAESLRAALVVGQMRPGVVYSVPMLAERFGVCSLVTRRSVIGGA